MNKTPHRLLHDALTAEQYKQVLVNIKKEHGVFLNRGFYKSSNAAKALNYAFSWAVSSEGHDHWDAIYDSLLERGL